MTEVTTVLQSEVTLRAKCVRVPLIIVNFMIFYPQKDPAKADSTWGAFVSLFILLWSREEFLTFRFSGGNLPF